MSNTRLPAPLRLLLEEHRASHAPHYPPHGHTDHGPMAYLALHGLGAGTLDIERFAAAYRQRLDPLPAPRQTLHPDDWHEHLGRTESYPALLEFFEAQTFARGWQATLARYLPSLVSGWVKDLFHPLIRLAYGVEFEQRSEIAAGLAYLAACGDDPRLALAARLAPTDSRGSVYLQRFQLEPRGASFEGPAPFNRRYQQILDTVPLAPAGGAQGSAHAELTRACLEIFDTTHDFFALHLVTASHAFHVCSPWAGPSAPGVFSVGICAAYLALGAPVFRALVSPPAALSLARLAAASDEHAIKLAYSCRYLARVHGDPTYEWVAARYFDSHGAERPG
jgi:hypothetical protein